MSGVARGIARDIEALERRAEDAEKKLAAYESRKSEGDAALRERAEKAERERDEYRSELHSVGEALALANATTLDLLSVRAQLRGAQARLARYEAPGPALLTAPTGQGETGKMLEALIGGAFRMQHARCVAVVSSVAWQSAESEHSHGEDAVREAAFAAGVRAALEALTGEAER